MSSRPVRVGLMPTPADREPVAAPIEPATMKNADGRKIAGHFQRARFQALRRRQAHFAVRRVDAAAEAQQHALGVIARDGRLDHGRRPLRIQTGEQHRRLHLRAGDRQLVADAVAATRRRGSAPAACLDAFRCARPSGAAASRRAPSAASSATQSPISSLSKLCPASRPVIRRIAVPELPMSSACARGLEAAHARRRAHALPARSVCSICTPSARIASWSQGNLRFRESRALR